MGVCASTSFHTASCHQAENQYCHVRRIRYITLQLEFHTEILTPFAVASGRGSLIIKSKCDSTYHVTIRKGPYPASHLWSSGKLGTVN